MSWGWERNELNWKGFGAATYKARLVFGMLEE